MISNLDDDKDDDDKDNKDKMDWDNVYKVDRKPNYEDKNMCIGSKSEEEERGTWRKKGTGELMGKPETGWKWKKKRRGWWKKKGREKKKMYDGLMKRKEMRYKKKEKHL